MALLELSEPADLHDHSAPKTGRFLKVLGGIDIRGAGGVFLPQRNDRRGFIEQGFQVGAAEAGRDRRNVLKIDVLAEFSALGVDFENWLTALAVGKIYRDLADGFKRFGLCRWRMCGRGAGSTNA